MEGTLEVLLVSCKDLEDKHIFTKLDPYVVITYHTQEKKSRKESGTNPMWNETFLFSISEGNAEINVRIMDKDTFSDDDFIGETSISIEEAIEEGSSGPNSYQLSKRDKYRGEVRIGLKFIPNEGGFCGGCGGGYGGGCDDDEDDDE